MSQKYDYTLTEDGGAALCEHEYDRLRAFWFRHYDHLQEALEYLRGGNSGMVDGYWIAVARRCRAHMRRIEKERDWWYEAGKKYGMIPF